MSDVQANIVIKGNADDAVKALQKVKSASDDMGKSIDAKKTVLKDFLGGITPVTVGAAAAGAALVSFGKASVFAADSLQALNSRAKVIYGEALPGVTSELAKFSTQTGRAADGLLEFGAGFAAIANGANIPTQAAADMSVQLAKLTTDFGSFFHVADEE